MSDQEFVDQSSHRSEDADRRRQLRALLLSAADTARQGRHVPNMPTRATRPAEGTEAVRDRVSMLVRAAS
jgi:hypothetical protein